jgi:tRNA A37 threonylcarbamoyladenosine synthetase subunit TsaC/SUA5/YrdC
MLIRLGARILTAEILRINPIEPEPDLIDRVVKKLDSGQVVALPTDTFYGLAVDPVNQAAVAITRSTSSPSASGRGR